MARFDDEVGEDLVEGCDCGGVGRVGVAEGGEEGGDWVGVLVGCEWGFGVWRGLTVVVAEDLALLADAGAWFGHGCGEMCVCV